MAWAIDPVAVRRVMDEFDRIGEKAFFQRTWRRPIKKYNVAHPDDSSKSYPSAAIAQAALGWDDVRGGYDNNASACVMLEKAGFEIQGPERQVATAIAAQAQSEIDSLSATERQAWVAQRVGQNILRAELIRLRGEECEITGIEDGLLLRASHIKPWAACESASERYDVNNAILLSGLWDLAFDRGLVTFDDEGDPIYSSVLSKISKRALQKSLRCNFWPSKEQCVYLRWHRENLFQLDR